MANKQRFVDANGVDLPILDKLRAAVDAKNNGDMGSKGTAKPAENKNEDKDYKYYKNNLSTDDDLENISKDIKKEKEYFNNHKDEPGSKQRLKELNAKEKVVNELLEEKKNKPAENSGKPAAKPKTEKTQEEYEKEFEEKLKGKDDAETLNNIVEAYDKLAKELRPEAKEKGVNVNELDNPALEALGKLRLDYSEKNISDGEKKYREEIEKLSGRMKEAIDNEFGYEKEEDNEKVPFGGVDKTDEGEGKEALAMADKINDVAKKGELKVGDATFKVDKEGKEWAVRTEIMNAIKCKEGIEKINKDFEKQAKPKIEEEMKQKLEKIKEKLPDIIKEGKLEENKKIVEERLERANSRGQGMTIDEVVSNYKKDLINKIENKVKEKNGLFSHKDTEEIELLTDVEHQIFRCSLETSGIFYNECKKLLEEAESEAEKHQNRSEAMKGNQNAKKYGLTDDQIEYYDIQEVVEDVNGYGIVKNSEGKYSYIDDGSVKNRPEDFEETIEKVKDRIEGAYQTKLNVEAAKAYDFENANFGKDVKVQKKSNGKYEFYKRDPNSTKGISVIVEVSNMREPFNMTYEVFDAKTGEGYQYDASYGNKEGLDWASERPEQMEKELKKFFKRDPVKEWDKMNSDVDPDAVNIEPVKSVTAMKTPIGKSTKIAEGKVSIPATKEVKNEIKQLISCLNKDKTDGTYRDVMKHVYYDGENMIATDGIQLKVINVGELNGIEPNKYVNIDTKGKDIVIEQDEKDYGRYPAYKRVLPENNKQQIRLNNNILKQKIEEMKKDGSINMEGKRISLKVDNGNVYLDGVRVGSAEGVKFADDRQFIDFNYKLLTNALSGDESIMAVSDNPERAVSISTNVSDNILMPLRTDHNEVDYESNRKAKAEADAALEQKRAQDAADREDRMNRSITDAAKSEILKDKPEGVTDSDYEDLIDYCNDFYAKLGYDNSTERGKRDIKRTIDNAIKGIYDKDYEILDMIENPDNKVSRKVFETITALRLGSNRESAKQAWESWVGKEGVKAHKDKIAAAEKAEKDRVEAEKKAADDAEREQYHGFMDGKTPAGKGRAREILAKKGRFDDKVYTYQELADHYINELGGHASERTYTTNGGKEKKYYMIADSNGRGYEVPKIVYDYAAHIQNGGVKKSIIDVIMMNDYEHDILDDFEEEDEEKEYNDYSAEQPELFNSTEFMVEEAFNRHCDCM